tara:strand:- start:90 stop:347 length:258 start_codon:yes stop_codon:yes gene_type:complete
MKQYHPPKYRNFENAKENPAVRDRFLNQLHRWDARRTDQKLKVCPLCERVWEAIYIGLKADKKRCEYYDDFPKFGKLKVICNKCL